MTDSGATGPDAAEPTPPPVWAAPDASAASPDSTAAGPPPGMPRPSAAASSGGWQPSPGWGAPPGWGPQPGTGLPPGAGTAGGWGAPPPPEVKPGVVPLRPLALGELLDGAVSVVRRYPRPTLGLSAIVAVVSSLAGLPFLLALRDTATIDSTALENGDTSQLDGAFAGALTGFGAAGVVSFLAGIVLTGVITAVVGRAVLGQEMTLGQAWRSARPVLLRLVGLSLLIGLILAGVLLVTVLLAAIAVAAAGAAGVAVAVVLALAGLALCVHLYVRLSLAASVVVLERARVVASLRRSAVLVKGSWWRVLGVLMLASLITAVVGNILQAPFSLGSITSAFSGDGSPPGVGSVLLQAVGGALASAVVAPFGAAVHALLYVDRRIRAEALDISLTAAASGPAGLPTA